jgi:hypothetical protein
MKLENFVDRTGEMRRFEEMLSRDAPSVMVVWGDSGMGKTSLLAKMVHRVSAQGLKKIEIVWTDTRNYDFLGIMRKCRDDLGAAHFEAFTRETNRATSAVEFHVKVEGDIHMFNGASIRNSQIGDVTAIAIRDNMFNLPAESQSRASERMMLLTDAFFSDLAAYLATVGKPVVLFLDAVEKMSAESRQWLWGELLATIRDDRLRGLKVVTCGREKPERSRDFDDTVDEAELGPLGTEDVCDYLQSRGITANTRELAAMLIAARGSKPVDVATAVDAYLRSRPQTPP